MREINRTKSLVGISGTLVFAALALTSCGSPAPVSTVAAPVTTAALNCIPITQSIPFSGTGLSLDASNNLYGGTVPNSTTPYGQMIIGGTATVTGTLFNSINSGSPYSSGNFQITVQPASNIPQTATTAAVSGTFTIGAAMQQNILATSTAGTGGYGTSTTPCVSGVAIQGHLYTTGGYGFGGYVYLYLNNTMHGETLTFQ